MHLPNQISTEHAMRRLTRAELSLQEAQHLSDNALLSFLSIGRRTLAWVRAQPMVQAKVPACISVVDFLGAPGVHSHHDAFYAALKDKKYAADDAKETLADAGFPGHLVTLGVEFLEFDSSNISHACAHFEVTLHGISQSEADALLDRHFG